MSDAGCSTEQCTYTGTNIQSNAEPGNCTATNGYIANAEITDILNNASRVNSNYIDVGSNTNILVYDDIQWVGYMDDSIKSSRKSLYQGYGFGGTSDWATDLAEANNPPDEVRSWAVFKLAIQNGIDPSTVRKSTDTSDWLSITDCTNQYVSTKTYTPSQRWAGVDGPDAWADCQNQWTSDQGLQAPPSFPSSLSTTLTIDEAQYCGGLDGSHCLTQAFCTESGTLDTGIAAYLIYNSMTAVRDVSISALLFRKANRMHRYS
jgi:hypothetical protein